MGDENERMVASVWHKRILLLEERVSGAEAEIESALRHAFHLVQLAPPPFDTAVYNLPDEAEYESRLEAGRYVQAAEALLDSMGFQSEIDFREGQFRTKISSTIIGASAFAKAIGKDSCLLLGWLRLVNQAAERAQEKEFKVQHPSLRRCQFGQRPPLSER
ncbi:hypothetical protein [Aurantiacibacter luteus]|uniref:hypothetical protein n=1 Tax=Aurantiacibacter luteus TaxID=1581420 RepID=UPI0012E0A052|nr:hypothetical protein [Aurantiacibacter luteus]